MPPPVRRRRPNAVRDLSTTAPAAVVETSGNPLRSVASRAGNSAFARYAASMGDVRLVEHKAEVLARLKLDLAKAKKRNRAYAALPTPKAPSAIGWGNRLESVPGAEHLAALWKAGRHDEFAHAVAELQLDLGFPERDVDGVLGPGTWGRMAGIGEATATIEKTVLEGSVRLCYEATEERMRRGHRVATGKPLELPEGATKREFERIIATPTEGLRSLGEEYRGAGAAGALVYAGLGEFVPEAEIWSGGLRPGATLQVFEHKQAYDLLRRAGDKRKNKLWQRLGDTAFFSGTSYVFVRYDTKTNEKMLVRHFGRLEWVSKREWAVWVAANPRAPTGP
jgi:hypothetical protein